MSAFNIWVTEKCNLNCTYCYEGGKRSLNMTEEVVENTISFIHENMDSNGYNLINFHGGEPLIAIETILKIVSACNNIGGFNYSLTTNGTLLSEPVLDKLKDNRIFISLSLDGTKKVHDLNRKKHDGTGTYDIVVNSMKLLQEREIPVRVRMTVTPETVLELYDSVMNIVQLNAKNIVAMIDIYDNSWTNQLIDVLKEQLIRTHIELFRSEEAEFTFYNELKKIKKGLCDGGISNYNIAIDGMIYPCSCLVNDKDYVIGSVYNGVDNRLLEKHKIYYDQRNITCSGCSNELACLSLRCKFINKTLTGKYLTAPPIICKLEHILYDIRALINN